MNRGTGIPLFSERLTLREFVPADETAVHAYASDPVVTRFLVWGPNTVEDTHRFIREAIAGSQASGRTNFDLAVVHTESTNLVGGAAIRVTDTERHEGEIGYVFGRDVWSRGYATEAATALLRFGFHHLGLRRIAATCDAENLASERVLQKAGMQAVTRVQVLVRESWCDSLLFAAGRE